MKLQPLGPQGVQARMAEIRAKLGITDAQNAPVFSMPAALDQSGMAGQITPKGTLNKGGFVPFNPMGGGATVTPEGAPADIKAMIERAANNNNIDPAILDALVATESDYNPSAISSKRAVGLTQLMPDTARSLGVSNPLDPAQNLEGGAKYLSQLLNRFDGNLTNAIAAYNAGPGAVTRHGGVPPYKETKNYVDKVLGLYRAKKGA